MLIFALLFIFEAIYFILHSILFFFVTYRVGYPHFPEHLLSNNGDGFWGARCAGGLCGGCNGGALLQVCVRDCVLRPSIQSSARCLELCPKVVGYLSFYFECTYGPVPVGIYVITRGLLFATRLFFIVSYVGFLIWCSGSVG